MSAPASRTKYLPVVAAVVVILVLVVAAVLWLRSYLGREVQAPKQVVQEVRIVRPPPPPETPPPPPPPPPEEEVDVPEPPPQPEPVAGNEPPPGTDLGIDAEGTGSGDSFGLVGKPGGRDLLATGGASGAALASYAQAIRDAIQERLNGDPGIRSGSYTVRVRLWVRNGNEVERANLVGSSGDKDRDRAIERVLSQLTRLPQTIPPNTPQPINVRIVSRA